MLFLFFDAQNYSANPSSPCTNLPVVLCLEFDRAYITHDLSREALNGCATLKVGSLNLPILTVDAEILGLLTVVNRKFLP